MTTTIAICNFGIIFLIFISFFIHMHREQKRKDLDDFLTYLHSKNANGKAKLEKTEIEGKLYWQVHSSDHRTNSINCRRCLPITFIADRRYWELGLSTDKIEKAYNKRYKTI